MVPFTTREMFLRSLFCLRKKLLNVVDFYFQLFVRTLCVWLQRRGQSVLGQQRRAQPGRDGTCHLRASRDRTRHVLRVILTPVPDTTNGRSRGGSARIIPLSCIVRTACAFANACMRVLGGIDTVCSGVVLFIHAVICPGYRPGYRPE